MAPITPRQELPFLFVALAWIWWSTWPEMPAMAIGIPVALLLIWSQPMVFDMIDRHFDGGEE